MFVVVRNAFRETQAATMVVLWRCMKYMRTWILMGRFSKEFWGISGRFSNCALYSVHLVSALHLPVCFCLLSRRRPSREVKRKTKRKRNEIQNPKSKSETENELFMDILFFPIPFTLCLWFGIVRFISILPQCSPF